jgi:hypothetical protein
MTGPSTCSIFAMSLFFNNKERTKKADQKGGLVRCLVRLVRSGPNRTKILQGFENQQLKPDQVWTKIGPRTVLVRSPRPFRAGGESGSGLNFGPKGCLA